MAEPNYIPDEADNFLVVRVSHDARQIGIDHPTNAPWEQVLAAHLALRDRLNERIAEQRNCPFAPKPSSGQSE